MFRKLREWISDNRFWYGVLQRTIAERNYHMNDAIGYKAMAKHYEDLWQRSVDDHAATLSFYQAQVAQLTKERDEKEIAFTLPNGVKLVAEYNRDSSWESIDVVAHAPNGRFEMVCCADYEHDAEYGEPRGLRIFSYNGRDDEYCHEVLDFDFSYLLGKNDLDADTEQDYIDQIIQEQADRESALLELATPCESDDRPRVRVLHPVRHNKAYRLVLSA